MPDVPGPKHPVYDPFEDDDSGYIDSRPGVAVGSADFRLLYDLNGKEIIDYLDCYERLAQKRVPLGFQLPAKRGVRERVRNLRPTIDT